MLVVVYCRFSPDTSLLCVVCACVAVYFCSGIDYAGFPPCDFDYTRSTEDNYSTSDEVSVSFPQCPLVHWASFEMPGAHTCVCARTNLSRSASVASQNTAPRWTTATTSTT